MIKAKNAMIDYLKVATLEEFKEESEESEPVNEAKFFPTVIFLE